MSVIDADFRIGWKFVAFGEGIFIIDGDLVNLILIGIGATVLPDQRYVGEAVFVISLTAAVSMGLLWVVGSALCDEPHPVIPKPTSAVSSRAHTVKRGVFLGLMSNHLESPAVIDIAFNIDKRTANLKAKSGIERVQSLGETVSSVGGGWSRCTRISRSFSAEMRFIRASRLCEVNGD